MILTNQELVNIAQAAIIAKLARGVEMPEPCIYAGDASPLYEAPVGFTADQLRTVR